MREYGRRFLRAPAVAVAAWLAAAVVLAPRPALPQTDHADNFVLEVHYAKQLAEAAMDDAVGPIGSLLGRIGPPGTESLAFHGLGYAAVSLGTTALSYSITNPDYTESAGRVEGTLSAVYLDFEIGLFRGYRTEAFDGILGTDLLVRVGGSVGDMVIEEGLAKVQDVRPVVGAGFRVQALRGSSVPVISVVTGVNRLPERSITGVGSDTGTPFKAQLDYEQTSAFLVAEGSKRWGDLAAHVGGGASWQHYTAGYRTEVIQNAGNDPVTETVGGSADIRKRLDQLYGGLEFGRRTFAIGLEVGASDGEPFGSLFLRYHPNRRGGS